MYIPRPDTTEHTSNPHTNTQEVPPGTDPHVVAAALILALRMLPEPLLTFEKYHAFLAAARLMDPSEVRHVCVVCHALSMPSRCPRCTRPTDRDDLDDPTTL